MAASISATCSGVSGARAAVAEQQRELRRLLELLGAVDGVVERRAGHDRPVVGEQHRAMARGERAHRLGERAVPGRGSREPAAARRRASRGTRSAAAARCADRRGRGTTPRPRRCSAGGRWRRRAGRSRVDGEVQERFLRRRVARQRALRRRRPWTDRAGSRRPRTAAGRRHQDAVRRRARSGCRSCRARSRARTATGRARRARRAAAFSFTATRRRAGEEVRRRRSCRT